MQMPAFVRISLLFLAACLAGTESVRAAQPAGARPQVSNEELRVSLLTILPGTDIYSLWGHSAIRIVDPRRDLDVSYNYGTFDFDTDFFVFRFLHGSLDYRLSLHDFEAARRQYRAEGRPMIEQTLDLSPAQQERLVTFLETNLQPENRYYRYDFLFDNCSTRIRDALRAALGDEVAFGDEPDPGATFRQLIDPYQRRIPFLDPGIDWLLGTPVDRVALPFQTMFLPEYLMLAFDDARLSGAGGGRPLVARTDTLLWIEGYRGAGPGCPWEAAVMWLLLAGVLFVTVRRPGAMRVVDGPLLLVTGLAGVLITYLWFVSHHDVTEMNWHLLWAWPTHAVVGGLVLRHSEYPLWMRRYMVAAGAAALFCVAVSPFAAQAFHPALVPIALLLLLRGTATFLDRRVDAAVVPQST